MKFLILGLIIWLTACGGSGTDPSVSTIVSVSPAAQTAIPVTPVTTISSSSRQSVIVVNQKNWVKNYAVKDLDGDGLDDVVIGGWTGKGTSYLSILIQNLNGTLTDRTTELLGDNQYPGSMHIFIADFDHDGYADIWLPGGDDFMTSSQSIILWGSATGKFTRQTVDSGIASHGGCVADLDGDGNLDVLIQGTYNQNNNTSGYYTNNGNRSFSTLVAHQFVNGASACDVIRDSNTGHFAVFQSGSNQFGRDSISIVDSNLNLIKQISIPIQDSTLAGRSGVAAVDANGDGLLDFVINYEPWTSGQPGRKEVWLNQGSDSFVYGYTLDNVNTGIIIPFNYNGDQYCFFVGSGLYKRVNGKLVLYKPVEGVSVVYRGSGGLYVLEEGWPHYTTRRL